MKGRTTRSLLILAGVLACAAGRSAAAMATTPTASATQPTTICASHILVRFWGAVFAKDLRTSPVARVIALKALEKAKQPGADFDAIGREFEKAYPDILYERLEPFGRGKMIEPFEKVVFSLKEGQVADEITTTIFGFHVIRRNPAIHCRHILITYQGASRSLATRSREEARALAEKVRREALEPGADFVALVRRYSEAPDKVRGGDVGVFDRGRMIQSFEEAAFALKPGEISAVVETRFGFHIIQRIE
ncbi:MAG: peptidyl-prolyl cis-trans isomerase [Candidatus Sumerlaeia bacterium]|nr:peptidyl-prolyl cis-trans isomerase [Candidatus Sumerlaeia bacterium]